MKKVFINILITTLLFIPSVSQAMTLKGGVEKVWTVDSAREEAFNGIKDWVDLSKYQPTDPKFRENKKLIDKDKLETKDRHITVFSDGWYAVRYYNNMTESYYYNTDGALRVVEYSYYAKDVYTMADINKYSPEELFPSKDYQHQYPSGKIIRIRISPKYMDEYCFKPNGELVEHCVDDKCYDANNNLIMTRESE